jgi:hypothetical protein
MDNIDWGDFTSALNAFFSLAAFVSAVIAALYARGMLLNDSARRQQEVCDLQSAQAGLISAWPTIVIDELLGEPEIHSFAFAGVAAHIKNASFQPVYAISVEFFYKNISVHKTYMNVLPPDTTQEELIPSQLLSELSEDGVDFETPMSTWDARKASKSVTSDISVEYEFTDTNQQKWSRKATGELSRHYD